MSIANIKLAMATKLMENQLTISFAESVTGGLLMSSLVSVHGVSAVFKGGIVCYQKSVKSQVLKVPEELIEKHSCESPEVTTAMTMGLGNLIPADVCLGITGLASEGASEGINKPIGTIYMTIIFKTKVYERKIELYGSRDSVRLKAAGEAYGFVLEVLEMPQ